MASHPSTETIRIAMWSGPRNISTAMMRAWGSRADCQVTDEPFYAAYLASTGLDHPMRDAVLASRPTDWAQCASLCAADVALPVHFQKHMCQHLIAEAPLGWMSVCRHAFLIRPPQAVAASFHKGWAGMGADDLGFRRQAELFDHACQITGAAPPVLEVQNVLQAPEKALRALCSSLGLAFDPAMLTWSTGPHDSDGVWGAHWYVRVNASTGFAPHRVPGPVPAGLEGIVAECLPYYEKLKAHRLEV